MSPNSGAEVEAERFASAFDTAAVAPVRPMTLQATRSGIALYPDVLPSAVAADRDRLIDPLDPTSGKVYVQGRGYIKNPTATELSKIIVNGKVGGGFENGEFMYVVDERGVMWVETAMQNSLERNIDRFDELNAVNPDSKIYLNMEYRLIFIEATSGPGTEENGPIEGFYDATFVAAELSETPVADGLTYHHSDYCFGSTTKYRTLNMSQELRVGDLYADETETLDPTSTKGTTP